MNLKIIRTEKSIHGVFGVALMDSDSFCVTLEPEDHDNQQLISCIPPGAYICERTSRTVNKDTFEITGVPGREDILFHAGNTEDDTLGCVILAQYFGKLRGQRAVLNSGKTFKSFMKKLEGVDRFLLVIEEVV